VRDRSVGGPENYHEDSDRWLFVVSGTGVVTVNSPAHRDNASDLVRSEAGERHGIENGGDEPLEIGNFYTPPR